MATYEVTLPNGKTAIYEVSGNFDGDLEAEIMKQAERDFIDDEGHDFSAMEMLKNTPGSFAGQFQDLYNAVTSPVETGKAIGKAAIGAAQKLYPGEQEYEKNADAVADFYANKYGSWERFKKAAESDPAGVLGDASALLGGSGLALRAAGLAKAGRGIGRAGAAVDPLNIVANTAKAATLRRVGRGSAPVNLYGNATGMDPKMAETALAAGVLPNQAGIDQVTELAQKAAADQAARVQGMSANTPFSFKSERLLDQANARARNMDDPGNPNRHSELAKYNAMIDQRGADLGYVPETVDADGAVIPGVNELRTPTDVLNVKKNLAGPARLVDPDPTHADIRFPTQESMRMKLDTDTAAQAQKLLEDADIRVGQSGKSLAEISQHLDTYARMLPKLEEAAGAAQAAKGNLGADMIIPSGLGYNTGSMMGQAAGAAQMGGIMATAAIAALSKVNKPAGKAKLARYLYNTGKDSWFGYATNNQTLQAIQAITREAGEEQE